MTGHQLNLHTLYPPFAGVLVSDQEGAGCSTSKSRSLDKREFRTARSADTHPTVIEGRQRRSDDNSKFVQTLTVVIGGVGARRSTCIFRAAIGASVG